MSRGESNFERYQETRSDAAHSSNENRGAENRGAEPTDASDKLFELILQETEKLLQRTAQGQMPKGSIDPEEMGALSRIAERRRGEPFSLDPICKEMTEAVLEKTFRPRVGTPAAWEALTLGIAQTLYDDPAARDRMQSMWERLSGRVA